VIYFAFDVSPRFGIFEGLFLFCNVWPDLTELSIEFKESLLRLGQFIFREDGINRTFWFAKGAVDTLVGVNYQKVWAFVEAINRAYFYTISMFTFNATITYYKCHKFNPCL